jgi:hypothetical protein
MNWKRFGRISGPTEILSQHLPGGTEEFGSNTVWHRETGKFEVTLTKVRKMNLQVLLLKTKSKLHAIKCPNTKNSISNNNVHKMMAIRTYAFLEANAEISHDTWELQRFLLESSFSTQGLSLGE